MFWAMFSPIIRSTWLYLQRLVIFAMSWMSRKWVPTHPFIIIRSLFIIILCRKFWQLREGSVQRGTALLYLLLLLLFSTHALQPSRLIVRSGLDVPTFATRCLHACHHARSPSGGRWNCGREMSGNFA